MTPLLSRRAVVLPLFVAIAVAFTYPLFRAPMHLGHGDWLWYHFTWDTARRSIVGFHELPWWNPYSCGGSLGLANPQSFGASPLFLLLLPLPTALAMKVYLAICTFLGLAGTWELCASNGARGPFAILAAMLFACSGTLGWHMNGQTAMAAFAGLPWVMLYSERARTDARFGVAAGAVLATMTLSAGVYPTAIGVLLVAFLFALDVASTRARLLSLVSGAVTTGLSFVGFAAVKLVPMLEYLRDHGRPVGRDDAISPSLLLPMLLERRTTETQIWPHEGYIYAWWGEYGNYVGWTGLAVVLALAAFAGRRGLRPLALALVALALLLGDHGVASPYRWLRALPVFGSLRVPTRYWVLVNLGVALLVALGGDALARRRRAWASALSAALLGASVWVGIDLVRTNGIALFSGAMQTPPAPPDEPPAPIRQVQGESWAMYRYPPRNLGTLSCFDEVTVELSPRLRATPASEVTLEPPSAGTARVAAWTPSSVTVDVDLSAPARLAVNQNGYRGWRVEGARLFVVAHQLGARVEAGTHRVIFRYRPLGYQWGSAVTLGTLALAAALSWSAARRRRAR